MKDNDLARLLSEAVSAAYAETPSLFDKKGIEQAMVFRIGIHLHKLLQSTELKHYQLDCEYNKKGDDPKRDINGTAIRPDLIVHQRGDNHESANKLAVEFKEWWNKNTGDTFKLENLTHRDGGYAYQLGVFVVLGREAPEYTYFKHGVQCR